MSYLSISMGNWGVYSVLKIQMSVKEEKIIQW